MSLGGKKKVISNEVPHVPVLFRQMVAFNKSELNSALTVYVFPQNSVQYSHFWKYFEFGTTAVEK